MDDRQMSENQYLDEVYSDMDTISLAAELNGEGIQWYPTRESALAAADLLRGWQNTTVKKFDFGLEGGIQYCIKTEGGTMCNDGYVR